MKKSLSILSLVLVASLFAFGQKTEERVLNPFDKLKVSSEVKVFLSKGNEDKVKIVASGIDPSEVETTINGKTLQIALKRGIYIEVNVEIFLTYKEIREITVGSSGRVSVQNPLAGDKMVLTANTNGELDAELMLKTADIRVGQGAVIRLKGKIGSIDAKVSTGGILTALDIQSDSTYVRVNSAGTAKVNALFLLDANVRTGGTLTYSGSPKTCTINSGLGASVNVLE
jgi:hypothetical protein